MRAAVAWQHPWGKNRGRVDLAIATRPPHQKYASTIMDLEEEVKTHTWRVGAGERPRYGQACPRCGLAKEEFFRVHDCRRRKFRLVLGRCIQVALSWILRWRCLCCGKRFTDYPPFRLATEAIYEAASAGEGSRVFGDGPFLR